MKTLKRFVSVLLALCMIIALVPAMTMEANAEEASDADIKNYIGSLASIYSGRFWNDGKTDEELRNAVDAGDLSFGLTDSGCVRSSDGKGYGDKINKSTYHLRKYGCTSNECNGCRQCWGFAEYMKYVVFGTTKVGSDAWRRTTDRDDPDIFRPGNVVRANGHSFMIWYVEGENLYVAEANWGDWCKVSFWKAQYTKTEVINSFTFAEIHPESCTFRNQHKHDWPQGCFR